MVRFSIFTYVILTCFQLNYRSSVFFFWEVACKAVSWKIWNGTFSIERCLWVHYSYTCGLPAFLCVVACLPDYLFLIHIWHLPLTSLTHIISLWMVWGGKAVWQLFHISLWIFDSPLLSYRLFFYKKNACFLTFWLLACLSEGKMIM